MIFNNKNGLILTGLVLVMISVICEVMLFIDYANNTLDKFIAGTSAGALVICQFAFVGLMLKKWETNKPFALIIGLIITVLFAVSVSGTAAFFESRFNNDITEQTQNSTAYKLKIETINDLKTQKSMIIENANNAKEKGNAWYSGEQIKAANAISESIEKVTQSLENTQIEKSNAGSTLASALGSKRWALWVLMALLVDICPLICFASIAKNGPKEETKTKPVITEKVDLSFLVQDEFNNPNEGEPTSLMQKRNKSKYSEFLKPQETYHQEIKTDFKEPTNENETEIKTLLVKFLKKHDMNQNQFCEKFDIKPKHLSLAKNHELRKSQNKETAPAKVIEKILTIINPLPKTIGTNK